MTTLILVAIVGLLGGITAGVHAPLVSMISERLGILESSFIIHIGGTLVALIPLLLMGGGKLGQWRSVPWYALGAGALGLAIVAAISYTIPRIGTGATVSLLVVGQLSTGAVLDHFGWLGVAQRPLTLERLLGMVVLVVGTWLVVR